MPFFRHLPLLVFGCFLLFSTTANAQTTQRTIQVRGESKYNLSPDEIVIQLAFQEYFTDPEENIASKVLLEELEKKVYVALQKADVAEDKITVGGVKVVQPYVNRQQKRRRLNKTLFICLNDAESYVKLTRTLESEGLFDEIITAYSISEFRHTQKEAYLTKSRNAAYQDARKKAELILADSGGNVGEVMMVKEVHAAQANRPDGSFYTTDNLEPASSGFQPIVIAYTLDVTFAIE